MYLRPGGTWSWTGEITFPEEGRYVLRAEATRQGERVAFPTAALGLPAEIVVVVDDGREPPPPPVERHFTDVPPNHPASAAIEALAARGSVSGYGQADGTSTFRPDASLARAQFAKMLAGALALPVSEADHCAFTDVTSSGPDDFYPDNYIAAAAARGLLLGTSVDPPLFAPYESVTRRHLLLVAERAAPGVAPALPGDQWVPATRAEAAVVPTALLENTRENSSIEARDRPEGSR